ncbi:ABC transporter permease [Nocardia sp. NPDC059239]|uniref:ABC transporter permease n=1 Tax=unclassified Nocardia TaxID=2637762 RepID=UPI003689D45D
MTATAETITSEPKTVDRHTLWSRCLREPRFVAGLALTAIVLAIAFIGPVFAAHSAGDLVGMPYQGPSSATPLGTDYLGQDVLSRTLLGGRSVVWMAALATILGVVIGSAIGLLAGYSSGLVDNTLMRIMDIILAFPGIVLVLLFVSLLGPKPLLISGVVALAWIPGVARVVRGATMEVAKREYTQAAQALGASTPYILFREILPNVITPIMVEFGLRLTWSIGVVAAISFVGQGLQPPAADWGLMVNQNRLGLAIQPWGLIAPVLCIAVFTLGTNLLTEGVGRVIGRIGPRRNRKKGTAGK